MMPTDLVGAALPLFVAVPILLAGLLVGVRLPSAGRQAVLVVGLAAHVSASALLLSTVASGPPIVHRVGLWPAELAIPFVADAFGALMLVLTGAMTLICAVFAVASRTADQPFFAPLVLVITAGVSGAVLTGDLFNLFVFVELMLLPSYALVILAHWGLGLRMQLTATRIYVAVNLLTSTLLLVGVGVIYATLGTVNIAALAGRGTESVGGTLGSVIVIAALAIKAGTVPAHGWVVRTYPHMSPAITALFSGLHTKVAVYGLFRFYSVVFDGGREWSGAALAIVAVSMVVAVVGSLGEQHGLAVMSFHLVAQLGFILLGLALYTPAALTAGVFYLVYSTITKTSLFLSLGAVELTYGRRRLGQVSGLLRRDPVTAAVFGAAALSMVGIPPFAGFVAKVALVTAAWDAGAWVAVVVALLVSVLTLVSLLQVWGALFLGEPTADEYAEGTLIPGRLIAPAAVLAIAALALGIGGEPLLQLASHIAAGLIDPAAYVKGVLG